MKNIKLNSSSKYKNNKYQIKYLKAKKNNIVLFAVYAATWDEEDSIFYCEHYPRNDYFTFNFSKTVTIIKAIQIKNFTSTLYNRWQKFEKIKPNENPINESWTDYYDYYTWYISLVATFSNFLMQNYIKVQGKKPYKELESDINAWFDYIKRKYKGETKVKTFDNIMNIEDFFRALMFFCSDFKIFGYIDGGWNEELKFVDRGLML